MFTRIIEGLPAELPKKNVWTLSERAGRPAAGRRPTAVRNYVITHLGEADASPDDQFQGMPAEGVGWAAAEATARRSGGGLPALVVEVAAGAQASGSTSGCVNRTGLPSDRA